MVDGAHEWSGYPQDHQSGFKVFLVVAAGGGTRLRRFPWPTTTGLCLERTDVQLLIDQGQ